MKMCVNLWKIDIQFWLVILTKRSSSSDYLSKGYALVYNQYLKNTSEIMSKEELLKHLQVKTISCKDVTFRIFGFSLTTFNMLLSLILVILLTKIFKDYEKFKK